MSGTSPQDTSNKSIESTGGTAPLPQFPNPGMVGHVRVLCILMWVQGGLEMLTAPLFCVFGMGCGSFAWIIATSSPSRGAPQTEQLWLVATFYGLLAATPLVTGLLRIYAALRNFQFQQRGMGIFAISLGLLSIVSLYLAPTAIALFVYGLIVCRNRETRTAFEMGERGCSYDEIHWTFWPQALRPPFPPQPYPAPSSYTGAISSFAVFGEAEADDGSGVVSAEAWDDGPDRSAECGPSAFLPPAVGAMEGQDPLGDQSADEGLSNGGTREQRPGDEST